MALRNLFKKLPKTIREVKQVAISIEKPIKLKEFKGKVSQSKKLKFNTKLGEEHPYDAKLTEGLYKKNGLAVGTVDKYVDFIVGPGFFAKSDDEKALKIITDFMRDVNMDTVLRAWLKEGFIKFSGFLEIGGKKDEVPQGLKVLDAKTMYVVRDDKAKVTGYNQLIGGSTVVVDMKKDVIHFEPFEIAQISFNQVGNEAYGLGILYPVITNFDSMLGNEKSMRTILKRKANSPLWAKLGNDEHPVNPEAVTEFGTKMEVLTDKTEFATDHLAELQVLDYGRVSEKFDFPIEHDLQMIQAGVQIPDILFGRNVNMAVAPVQMDAFERRAVSIQAEVEKVIENKIFKRVLKANDLDVHVEFEWGAPSNSEKNNRIEQITIILQNQLLNPNLRAQLEMELAVLMGLNADDLKSDQEEREDEEALSQPIVPGQNNPDEKVVVHICEDFEDDYSLKEWLGFEFNKYLDDIKRVVRNDEFLLAKATTSAELAAGKLSDVQVEKLRDVLEDGFVEGKSVREISVDIDERVDLKDLQRMKDGEVVTKDGVPVLQTSKAMRPIIFARSETTRLAALGARENYRRGGLEKYRWISSVGGRTCPQCESLNGLTFEIGKDNIMPPQHTFCRCTIAPVVDLEDV